MAWMTRLYETYENLKGNSDVLKACKMPLVPVSHTVQTAHVEVTLTSKGEFIRAECVPEDGALTVVPCTEDSASRSSGIAPHVLFDNLKYTAGDAAEYNADPKNEKNYKAYCEQLHAWCEDEKCPDFAKAVYRYVSKRQLIHDLIGQGILNFEKGKLKWNGGSDNKPAGEIFSVFVRFTVRDAESFEDVINSYIEYDAEKHKNEKICFVTGEKTAITYKHPAKIRYSGDSAKLISANDKSGFTFRGRYRNAEDAVSIGYDVSQKAHSALRWLIANQGFKTGDQTVVVWSVGTNDIPDIMSDSVSLFGEEDCERKNTYTPLDTYAKNVEDAINGYRHNDIDIPLKNNAIVIMILDAATPGRLSISYYRELGEFDYLDNIKAWHESCVWDHSYRYILKKNDQENGKKKNEYHYIKYTGAPSINDTITSVYGSNVDDKLKKQLIKIFISCIANKRKLPYDIVMKGVNRISNPNGMDEWDITKTTSIVCSLIRKYYYDKGEIIDMALDIDNNDRSYLFGRVLAYVERIEEYANYLVGEKRVPNARKLRSKYKAQPAKTLVLLDEKIEPYLERIYTIRSMYLYKEMLEVISRINEGDFMDNKPLSPKYLLGYASQMASFKEKTGSGNKQNEETENDISLEEGE